MLVVIEGIDGTGKQTQTEALADKLRMVGLTVSTIVFPRYGVTRGAGLVSAYLAGQFGQLDPFAAAMFFALDRFESKKTLEMMMSTSDVVICDRYVGSNMAHQAARVDDEGKKRDLKRFIMWLEYECHMMPVPDLQFLLRTTLTVSARNMSGREESDIHEADAGHQSAALREFDSIASETGWFVIDTVVAGLQRSREEISRELHGTVVRERTYNQGTSDQAGVVGLAGEIFGEIMQQGSEDRKDLCIQAAKRAMRYMTGMK